MIVICLPTTLYRLDLCFPLLRDLRLDRLNKVSNGLIECRLALCRVLFRRLTVSRLLLRIYWRRVAARDCLLAASIAVILS